MLYHCHKAEFVDETWM